MMTARVGAMLRRLASGRELAVYGCAVLLIGFGLFKFTRADDYWQLVRDHQRASGVVTATQCERHQSFTYAFDAGPVRASGRGLAQTTPCADLRPGDRVVVYYAPAAPANSINDIAPVDALKNDLITIIFTAIVFPALAIGAARRRVR